MKQSNEFARNNGSKRRGRRALVAGGALLVAFGLRAFALADDVRSDERAETAQRTEWSLIPEFSFKNPFAFGAGKENDEATPKQKVETREEESSPYLLERIFGRRVSTRKADPELDDVVRQETKIQKIPNSAENASRDNQPAPKERIVKATPPKREEQVAEKNPSQSQNKTSRSVERVAQTTEPKDSVTSPKVAEKVADAAIEIEPQPKPKETANEAPLPALDDEEIQRMLREFAELNEANERETEPAPVPKETNEPVKQRITQNNEAFLRELDEIKKLENSDAPVEAKFGYFKTDKPSENASSRENTFEPAPAVLFFEEEKETPNDDQDVAPVPEQSGAQTREPDVQTAESDASEPYPDVEDDARWITYESAEPTLVADQRAFGTTRPATQTNPRVPQGYVEARRAAAASNGLFNSAAYRGDANEAAARELRAQTSGLRLDDVASFAQEAESDARAANEAEFLDAVIVDSSDFSADELALETVDLETLKEECFAALDHYTSLFIEYEPTYAWTEAVLEDVDLILDLLENDPASARRGIRALKEKIAVGQTLKERVSDSASARANQGDNLPTIATRYGGTQRVELLDSLLRALERRAFVWSYAADYFEAKNKGKLNEQQALTLQELALVIRTTEETRVFFGDSPNGRNWRASFDVDELARDAKRVLEIPAVDFRPIATRSNAKTSSVGYLGAPVPSSPADPYLDQIALEDAVAASERAPSGRESMALERERRMRFLHDRINAVAYKFEKTPMTPEQRRVFEKPTLSKWARLVSTLAGDQTNGLALLYAFERYERLGGGDAGRSLQQLALRMTTSRSDVCRRFGRAFDAVYDNPNVKAYVSEALINRLLPVRDPEFAVVQERVLDNPVVGTRRVDTQVSIKLIPDPNRLLMNLNVNGRAVASTSSSVFSATLHNQSYVNYYATKTIEWRDSGIAYSPASVSASATNQLNAVETDVDFVPLVGDVAREITRSQYEARQNEIREETRQKTSRETRVRFDREANERFDALNTQLRSNFFKNMANLGLSLRTQRSRTTDDWLLASLRFGTESSLGCQSTEPATLPGAFADVKLHESAVNAFITQLQLGGRTMTPRQMLDYLAVKTNKPKLRDVKLDDAADIAFTFAKTDPVVVRFYEDQARLLLRFDAIELNNKTWNDLEVEVAYRPVAGENGAPMLTRDGNVDIYGPTSPREQLPIRAVFAKIFPASKSFEINPEILHNDERFAGLALGLCRVSKGWFAISVVRDPYFGRERVLTRR